MYDLQKKVILCGFKDRHKTEIRAITFHCTLPWLVSADESGDIHIWDLNTQSHLHFLSSHRYAVTSLSFADHCEDILVSASVDRSVRIWDCCGVASKARFVANPNSQGRAPTTLPLRCLATLSTASVTQAHESEIVWAHMPRSDLMLSLGADGCLKAMTVSGLTKSTSTEALTERATAALAKQADRHELEVDVSVSCVPEVGQGEVPPEDAFVDVMGVFTQHSPDPNSIPGADNTKEKDPPDVDPAIANGWNPLPSHRAPRMCGGGVLRLGQRLRWATVFANQSLALMSTVEVLRDEYELAPRIVPVCFSVIAGNSSKLATVDVQPDSSAKPKSFSATFAPVQFIATHSSKPHFVVVHADRTVRVLEVKHEFELMRKVHETTLWKPAERVWLARISKHCTFRKLSAEFAAFADPYGVSVTIGEAKSTFAARYRSNPAKELQVRVGLDASGRRAMQATFDGESDPDLWKDLLSAFALNVLARNEWLGFAHRRMPNTKTEPETETEASSCAIQ